MRASQSPGRISPATVILSGTIIALLAGCSGDEAAKNSVGSAESVSRMSAPEDRARAETLRLNTYRAQALSVLAPVDSNVVHSNVLYTAAYRHAVYLNSVNSALYDPKSLTGIEGSVVTPGSTYESLRTEAVNTTTTGTTASGPFPALATAQDPYNRVAAVAGGASLLESVITKGIREYYIFDGDIGGFTTEPAGGHFRGFNRAPAGAQDYMIDDLWYSRRGRMALMRGNLSSFAFASKRDTGPSDKTISPPWPILSNRFVGAVTLAYKSPDQAQLSIWPKNGMKNVYPMGLDTDLRQVAQATGGATVDQIVRHDFAGPPIHIVMPINVPFLLNPTEFAGGVSVGMQKMQVDPETGVPQSPPDTAISRFFLTFFAVPGNGTSVVFTSLNLATDLKYQYFPASGRSSDGATVSINPPDSIRNGELILVPTEPLEPLSWYEVAVRLRSGAAPPWNDFPGTQEAALENPKGDIVGYRTDGFYQFHFKTSQ